MAGSGFSCKKGKETPVKAVPVNLTGLSVNGLSDGFAYKNVTASPVLKISFSEPIDKLSISKSFSFTDDSGGAVSYQTSFADNSKTVIVQPAAPLQALSRYQVSVSNELLSETGGRLSKPLAISLTTTLDSTDKFPRISDEELLTLVQKQTFKYFWDFGHPVSGLARERNTSGDVVTTGGSGFGIMAIVTAVHRNFISRAEGLERMQQIVGFLKNKAERFHGAFPHWLNGNTGKAIAFSQKDNGADLVETSFLMQGLLTARQYFNGNDAIETALRNDINELWQGVEWD